MNQSPLERVPVEIWEKIISYATTTSLLPFTESGEIASSLIDTVDLFSTYCSTFQRYYYETIAATQCLRLVCRTWAAILRGARNGFAYVRCSGTYPLYQSIFGSTTYLWVGATTASCFCTDDLKWRRLCLCTQSQLRGYRPIDEFNEDFLAQLFSGHLRIAHWRPRGALRLTFPMKSLGNLLALSLSAGGVPLSFSLKDLFSSAPRLSHLRLGINDSCAHLLSESVEFLSLSYLFIEASLWNEYNEPAFVWSFPRLRTFVICGMIRIEHQAHLEGFLCRHKNSIVEFEVINLHYHASSSTFPYLNLVIPSLWNICPNIRVIGMCKQLINTFKTSEVDWETHSIDIPRLTFVMGKYYPLWNDDFATLTLIKKRLNVEKIVVTETWEQLNRSGYLRFKGAGIKTRTLVELLLERLIEMDISLFDRYDAPVTHFLRDLSTRLES
jgi:hypothetical protein